MGKAVKPTFFKAGERIKVKVEYLWAMVVLERWEEAIVEYREILDLSDRVTKTGLVLEEENESDSGANS